MKPSKIKIGNSIEELFFIISPPVHIKSDVSVLKDDVQYLIGHGFEDRHSTAHISLFRYDLEPHFDDITRHVEEVAAGFSAFNIFIKDLNVIHNGSQRTIFLDIVNKYPVRDIFEKLVKKDIQFTPTHHGGKETVGRRFSQGMAVSQRSSVQPTFSLRSHYCTCAH
ncbi:MAG: hypothetical protein ABIS36_04880 [Chryseolinea sp.]